MNDRLCYSVSRTTCSTAVDSSSLVCPQQPPGQDAFPQRDSTLSSRGRDAPRSRKKGSLVCGEESGKLGPGARKVSSAVQGRARPSLFEFQPQHLSTPCPGGRDLPWGFRALGLREAQVSAERPIPEQPRREGGPARPHASPLPVRPPGARSLRLMRPSPAALRATPPKASPQPAGTRSPSLTTPGGEQRAREPRAAAGGASAALTAAPAARAAERRRRWGGTCWLSQPRASPGTAPRPACPPPPGAAEGCGVLPASLAAALAAPRVEPGPGRPRVRWGAGAHPLY